jgi:hypothetical protein
MSEEEHWRRHLEYIREFAPQQFAEYAKTHPADLIAQALLAPTVKAVEGAETPSGSAERTAPEDPHDSPQPAADSGKLDNLLEAEQQAEAAGDAKRLAAIREQIDEALR